MIKVFRNFPFQHFPKEVRDLKISPKISISEEQQFHKNLKPLKPEYLVKSGFGFIGIFIPDRYLKHNNFTEIPVN